MTNYVYDIETFKEIFTFAYENPEDPTDSGVFEVSRRQNDYPALRKFLFNAKKNADKHIGFNNIGFDYPVLHKLKNTCKPSASYQEILDCTYNHAMAIIDTPFENRFINIIPEYQWQVNQIDLYKIHHFDNAAKATSLKLLEFNMRSVDIRDLPYPPDSELTDEMMDEILIYNKHDVKETVKFFHLSQDMIAFRELLTDKYDRNFMNHNDTKIGSDYFIMKLEEELGESACYKTDEESGKRVVCQTKRPLIKLKDIIFDYVEFDRPEFNAILTWLNNQELTQTKGAFNDLEEHQLGPVAKYAKMITKKKKSKHGLPTDQEYTAFMELHPSAWLDEVVLKSGKISYWYNWNIAESLNVEINGLQYIFGTGGLHASVDSQIVRADNDYMILDVDVTSYYPSLAIENRLYPAHLSEKFCDIYADMKKQRTEFAKGSAENAMLKLALNGTYGNSNNKYSPFFDPYFTMGITVNGQLLLCQLTERLIEVEGLDIIQCNTDGVTMRLKRSDYNYVKSVCKEWEQLTKLDLEEAEYSAMFIRDVNNYIAVYTNGKVKRKGTYEYDLAIHQNASALVVQRAVEAHLLHNEPLEAFIKNHDDPFDFYLRAKVPKTSKLVLKRPEGDEPLQNTTRYYISTNGGKLVKTMPPLPKKPDKWRDFDINGSFNVTPCNHVDGSMPDDIDYNYYIQEATKLVAPLKKDQ